MDIVIRKPTLGASVGAVLAVMLFAGRWGVDVESHTVSLSTVGSILYAFAFQLRCWLLILVGLLIAFDYSQRNRRSLIFMASDRGVLVFLALCCLLLTGAAFTDSSRETITKAFDIVVLVLTVLAVFYVQNRDPGSAGQLQETTFWVCFLLGTLMSVVALFTADLTQRASVAGGGPNTFVRIVGVTAIACIGLRKIPQVFALMATACYLLLIVLTQSRGGMLAFVCAAGLQFIWAFGWRNKLVFGVGALASIGLVANFTASGQRCVEIIQDRVFTQTFIQNYTAGRDEIYSDSWAIWNDAFLFGNGLNSWWDRLGTYPHNIILEIGCDSGLFGVALFALLICIYASHARYCKTRAAKSIACLTLFYFLAAQFSGDIYDSRGLFYFGTMLGSASVLSNKRPAAVASKQRSRKRPAAAVLQ